MDRRVMHGRYILDDEGNPVVEEDILKWGHWFETNDRHVADDKVNGVRISTVFLGLDHNFSFADGMGDPVLWETMVFGGTYDQEMDRYTSKDDALAGHARWVKKVRESQDV